MRAAARRTLDRAAWLPRRVHSAAAGNRLIAELVRSSRPAAAGKLGSVELSAVRLHERREADWGRVAGELHVNAGVFPPEPEVFARFARRYVEALSSLDVLGVWFLRGEADVARRHARAAVPVRLRALESYYHQAPWTRELAGKRVLVVSPFAATVEAQYPRREEIWPDTRGVLPAFELSTLRVPFSAAIEPPTHSDWLAALEELQERMASEPFDVALIGAGAWSLPLAAHAKALGRCGVHLGGSTQILFGIKGARWDEHPVIAGFYNDAWRRPADDERPDRFEAVERGCYW